MVSVKYNLQKMHMSFQGYLAARFWNRKLRKALSHHGHKYNKSSVYDLFSVVKIKVMFEQSKFIFLIAANIQIENE